MKTGGMGALNGGHSYSMGTKSPTKSAGGAKNEQRALGGGVKVTGNTNRGGTGNLVAPKRVGPPKRM